MRKTDIKEVLTGLRNGCAFCFSWLVLCTMLLSSAYGNQSISVGFLFKLFLLCFWGVLCFMVCFKNLLIKRKGFIFRLSVFYILFIPVEVSLFFYMNIFQRTGTVLEWAVFGGIIIGLYVICVLIDCLVYKKQGVVYTKQLLAYNERRFYEQKRRITEYRQ